MSSYLRNASQGVGFLIALAFAAGVAAQPPVSELGLLPGDLTVAPATNSQQEHSVAKGGDIYLLAWSDYRGRSSGSQSSQGDGDIFGVRVDLNGDPLDAAPFLIAGGMGLQQRPLVAWNGENWLVVYISQDPVGGYFADQMRAVRVSPAGEILDATPILFPPTEFSPSTIGLQIAGQAGQWLVTRCVYHDDGYGTFLAGQRIDGDGVLLDQTPIMLMDWVYGGTKTVVSNGEYLVAGPDWNTSWNSKARRVGLNGQPIGAEFSVPSLSIAGNGSEYYVVWIADYVNLVGSRMTSAGTLLTPSGTIIVADFSQYNQSTLTHDGANWWLEWGVSDILRTVRINAAGTVLDPNGGVLLPITIGGNVNTAYNPILAPRTGGGVLLFWYDLRVALGYDTNVFTLPISAANVAGMERNLSTGTPNQRNSQLSPGPNGTAAIAFVSEAANDARVLVHLLDASGAATTGEPIEVFRGPVVGRAGIAWNGTLFLVTWDEGSSGLTPTQIRARRLNADGTFVDAQPFSVMTGFNAAVEALGPNFLVAGARYATYPQFIYLVANRVDGVAGTVLDGSGLYLGGSYVSGAPRVRSDGSNWWVAAHSMWSHNASQGDAILAKVPPVGAPTAAFNPTPIAGGSGDLDIAFSGSKYLLVWRMNSLSNANNYIAGRIMNADGTFPPGYFTIAEAPGRQLRPTVAWDGTSFVVAWDDQRNQATFFDARTDVYGTRVSETGAVLDPAGLAICANPCADASPSILPRGTGFSLVSSTRYMTSGELDSYRIGITQVGALPVSVGDLNCDGALDSFDIGAFVLALTDKDVYALAYPSCDYLRADINKDGEVDSFDIAGFVEMVTGP